MFDKISSILLSEAPSLPTLNSQNIPQFLTRHYAELVSARLKMTENDADLSKDDSWTLERIADVYETIASIEEDLALRKAASFVSGTARLIISRGNFDLPDEKKYSPMNRDTVDSSVAAALLFLAAEQHADAYEAAVLIPEPEGPYELKILGEHIKDLVCGKLNNILSRALEWRANRKKDGTIQERALAAMAAVLAEGIEIFAANVMSAPYPENATRNYSTAQEAFSHVIHLSNKNYENRVISLNTVYAGPAHLASLLLSATNTIESAALTQLPPPEGGNEDFWKNWLSMRANKMPFIWPNHREAIEKEFYQTGKSSVLVLPTGAGKTTVSILKIAGNLSRGKKVIFLAPTHALVEQLTEELRAVFPVEKFGLEVSNDFDSLFIEDTQLQDIEVMTPERCLAMLSFTPKSFENVGLLVFDECHILSPQSGKIRRSLDSMLCLLAFDAVCPRADYLFLSAMLTNGQELADWVTDLTGRPCEAIDLLWKPSRQARGVVVYPQEETDFVVKNAKRIQQKIDIEKGKMAKNLRNLAKKELQATPHVVWGLRYNWLHTNSIADTKIMDDPVELGGKLTKYKNIWLQPNANKVASKIAVRATIGGMKTIVFVNTKDATISASQSIGSELRDSVHLDAEESKLWESLRLEFGHSKHSVFSNLNFSAVPHHASMLQLERVLSEHLFRREDGAKVIVATPTLAQGLNLPAHLAILAGDRRMGEEQREDLETHEILNAAARAGRAGHLANGVVLLIPEPVITFSSGTPLSSQLERKLTSLFPEDDRCVTISDPLEVILDRIMEGDLKDREVRYTINRLAVLKAESDIKVPNNVLLRSFGAFQAARRKDEINFEKKINSLWDEASAALASMPDMLEIRVASQSGIPFNILERLKRKLLDSVGDLPTTINGWVKWTINWLVEDLESREYLLQDVYQSALVAIGYASNASLDNEGLGVLLSGTTAWIEGKTINEIEKLLGGNPDSNLITEKLCPRSRELVSTFIPRGLSFIMMVTSQMVEELELFKFQVNLKMKLVKSTSIAVRKGFDTIEKLKFANKNKNILSRVQLHQMYREV